MCFMQTYVVPSQKRNALGGPYVQAPWSVSMLTPSGAKALAQEVELNYGVYPTIEPESNYGTVANQCYKRVTGEGLSAASDIWNPQHLHRLTVPTSWCLVCGRLVAYYDSLCRRQVQ